ncbi:NAD(P)-dependent dehydrogenase (short-subunit alcohol dehydrogenase family) [Kribbella aluminosa]|uniref:NAD(P)-dependent dehydrogenase (Short-subunit alcohol dehydrogenase family) n=1 Tax=Kribbella aluminosa TaxID=416017 RepID=A0ABS4UUZ1_9ACTN|nr:SDR family NAD(P)-dependent oxidoreductase [Kribbella aluminosa]MBP2355359.1 NAD(P)-dependent dehydrogenase (short-subunit alcohol dehydrogenase family) [Kribbella aluminosa]
MRIALITGANQGIGYALVEELAHRMNPEDLVLLTGRSPERVAAATRSAVGGGARVEGRVLDVTDGEAVRRLADEVGGVDIVVSNAVGPLEPGKAPGEQVDEFVDVANVGAQFMLRAFGPILRPGGRLIVVASSLGTLEQLPESLWGRFDGASLDDVEKVVEEWRTAVHDGTAVAQGWPEWINLPSKVAQVAAVRAVAGERREDDLAAGTLVASVCPGLVDTRASRPWFDDFSQAKSPADAVRPIADLILADAVDPALYGELIRDGKVVPWKPSTAR